MKTWSREVVFAIGVFLCYLTYDGKAQVADWITPFAFMFSIAYGAKQEVVKVIAEKVSGR